MPLICQIAALLLLGAFAGAAAAPPSQRGVSRMRAFLSPKVLVINFDPILRSERGKRLHEVCGWNDPRVLAEGYISDIRECSRGYVRYRVAEWIDADDFPAKMDGFRYTEESYLKCFREGKGWHEPDAIDYKAIIRDYDLARRVASGGIDEVWLWGFPYAGMWESTMAGKGAYWCNSPPVEGIDCPRIFVLMGFNYERGVGEMLEDLGHRTESILTRVYGSWEAKATHAWNRFTLYDQNAPGQAACGNIHFAPNSQSDYDWGNRRPISSACDDWLDYPRLTGYRRTVTCDDWGNGDIRSHHKWWFHRLPRAPGRTEGKLNNWWNYVVDFNRYQESR
ncbi:MAG: hypothetical protein IT210_04260 [Armatimonadetes bacterium]|nr:hypothetical protein [Armatimonadota bacterium]